MANHGSRSKSFLSTCTQAIQLVFTQVVRGFDHSILDGSRTPKQQKWKVESGASKTLDSKHIPRKPDGSYRPGGKSKAVDAAPYPIVWPDVKAFNAILDQLSEDERAELKEYIKTVGRFYAFNGYVIGTGDAMGVSLRGGHDWDGDWDFTDQGFDDLVHFEEMED